MANILVIGGAGYIGSHVAKQLKKLKHKILVFDNLSTGHKELVRYGKLFRGSLLQPKKIKDCLQSFKPESIFHFANNACVPESMAEPKLYYGNNVAGMLNLLNAIVEYDPTVPLIFSSSCAVYGEPKGPLTEDQPLNPVNPYGRCKKICEEMMEDYNKAFGLVHASLRYFNAAGADRQGEVGEIHHPEHHLIPRLIMLAMGKASKRDPVMICGNDFDTPDGTCLRDYIHVEDLAQAHIKALRYLKREKIPLVVNLGMGHGYSVQEIVQAVRIVSKNDFSIPVGPRRPGDPAMLVAVNSGAKNLLDWTPKYNLDDIIESAWQWANR